MKTHSLISVLSVAGCMAALLIACESKPKDQTAALSPEDSTKMLVERGDYLVNSMGCTDCHSPKVFGPNGPEPDPNRLFSGHPADMPVDKVDTSQLHTWVMTNMMNTVWVGPWGVSFTANITSDATGIGNWTEENFRKALREGKYKGMDNTRPLLPPMPWPVYKNLTDQDISAIFAYLKTTKPVNNVVPAPIAPPDINK